MPFKEVSARIYRTPVRIWGILSIIAILLGGLILWYSSQYQKRLLNEVYRNASAELSSNASSLSSIIESRLLLSNGLNAYITAQLLDSSLINQISFEAFASRFMANTHGIRNLSVYPDGIAQYIYPLKDNKELLGLNLLTHPDNEIRQNAERTMRTRDMTILGPLELTQGGLGLLSRQSIFERDRFWGFVSVVIDVPTLLEEAGLYAPDKGIDITVKANYQVIFGDQQQSNTAQLRQMVHLPEGAWELTAVPKSEKLDYLRVKVFLMLGTSIISLLFLLYILYVQLTQRTKLHILVNERTLNLALANKQLEATYQELTSTEEELREQYVLLENKEQTLRYMAYHDSVTGLYNRAFFNEQLVNLLTQNEQENRRIAVFFLDLDHFKMTNDTIGHFYGDILLYEVGYRLQSLLTNGEIISRFGGDEFTIILPVIMDDHQVRDIAQNINALFQQPFTLKNEEHFITTSIGIAISPDHGTDATTLIMNADMAMYRAKDEGKNQYHYYDASMNPNAEATMEIKNSLSRALDREEFIVYYQPQVDGRTGQIVSLEALLRWNHTKLGMIPPSTFIPIAEDTGLIVPIGEWVLQTVCAQVKTWQRAGLPPIRVAVNLSARHFMQNNLTERIKNILLAEELDPMYLELEITENIAMRDDKLSTLLELRNMGITLAIDDFGTQFSCLGYLKRLPVHKIKIDRSFINGIAHDDKDETIILAMLLIAQRMDLGIIAEGVETQEQLTFLIHHHCHEIQGFLFHKPQPAQEIEALLAQQAM